MFNILNLFGWKICLLVVIVIILFFWLIWGGKEEYEFIGINPLTTNSIFEGLPKTSFNTFDIPTYNEYSQESDNETENITEDVLKNSLPKSNKGEDIVAEVFEEIISSSIYRNIRPNFLRNPETGKNLELDCYNEEYAIAVEYNGIQHYKFPSVFYKNETEFMNQLYRDRLKKNLCDEAGIYLIPVPYWVDMYGSEEQHIKDKNSKLKINFVSREVRYKRIYDYLYEKISEYFQIIFPQQQNDTTESDFDRQSEYSVY